MMTYKQQEVLESIINTLQKKFPEVQLVSVSELNTNSYWITITEPSHEDDELKMVEMLGQLITDALTEYGFDFQFVTANLDAVEA